MHRHIIGTVLVFLILILSDFFMGIFGHYTATSNGDFSFDSFFSYLATVSINQFILILAVSLIIYVAVRFVFKKFGVA